MPQLFIKQVFFWYCVLKSQRLTKVLVKDWLISIADMPIKVIYRLRVLNMKERNDLSYQILLQQI